MRVDESQPFVFSVALSPVDFLLRHLHTFECLSFRMVWTTWVSLSFMNCVELGNMFNISQLDLQKLCLVSNVKGTNARGVVGIRESRGAWVLEASRYGEQ